MTKNISGPTLFYVKIGTIFIFFLFSTLTPVFSLEIDQNWALEYLLLENESDLDRAMTVLPDTLNDPRERALAIGILNVYKYLRNDTVSEYAYTAFENLENLSPPFEDAAFIFAYKGVANSLMAKEKTIFGVGNLKDMQTYMELIPREYNNWFVRFLRGSTLIQVGKNLPALFFRKMKEEAVDQGTKDLNFVIEEYQRYGVPFFDPKTYDKEGRPVPYPIFEQSHNFLKEE